MIIACPACSTKYNLPTASLGESGRLVKCAKCGNKWHQTRSQTPQQEKTTPKPVTAPTPPEPQKKLEPKQPEVTQQPTTAQQPAPQIDPTQTLHFKESLPTPETSVATQKVNLPALQEQIQQEKKTAFWQGIGIGAAAGVVLISTALALKSPIQTALPAVNRFLSGDHAADKLKAQAPQDHGLVIDNIERDILEEGGFTTYIIKGTVTNTNITEKTVPNLKVTLLDEENTVLDAWRVQAQKTMLNPGETTTWVCYFYNPPLERVSAYKVALTQ